MFKGMHKNREKWAEFLDRIEGAARSIPAREVIWNIGCPICRHGGYNLAFWKWDYGYNKCIDCEAIWLCPQPKPEVLKRFYNGVYEFFIQEIALKNGWSANWFDPVAKKLKQMTPNKSPLLVDIGCGLGDFMRAAKKAGFTTLGLDLNKTCVKHINEHGGTALNMTIEGLGWSEIDVITIWETIEHVPDPAATLSKIHSVLKSGGILGLSTVNHNSLNARILGSRWRSFAPIEHLYSFTPKGIGLLLNKCGFEVLEIQHQYHFEIFTDAFDFFQLTGNKISDTAKKILYVGIQKALGFVCETLKLGDVIRIYARKK